jgi:hypothetical protein
MPYKFLIVSIQDVGRAEAGIPANVAPGTPDPEHASPERQRREGFPGVEDTRKTTVAEFVRIRSLPRTSEFSRIRLRKCFTALPNGAIPESSRQSKDSSQNPVARAFDG